MTYDDALGIEARQVGDRSGRRMWFVHGSEGERGEGWWSLCEVGRDRFWRCSCPEGRQAETDRLEGRPWEWCKHLRAVDLYDKGPQPTERPSFPPLPASAYID